MYVVAFEDQAKNHTISVLQSGCVVTFLTPAANMLTPSLAAPCRMSILVNGANARVQIRVTPGPADPGGSGNPLKRFKALLGCNLQTDGFCLVSRGNNGTATVENAFGRIDRNPVFYDAPEYFNFAYTGSVNDGFFILLGSGNVTPFTVILDIGRFWLSDFSAFSMGVMPDWGDSDRTNGLSNESFDRNFFPKRFGSGDEFEFNWIDDKNSVYLGDSFGTGRAPLKKAFRAMEYAHAVCGRMFQYGSGTNDLFYADQTVKSTDPAPPFGPTNILQPRTPLRLMYATGRGVINGGDPTYLQGTISVSEVR